MNQENKSLTDEDVRTVVVENNGANSVDGQWLVVHFPQQVILNQLFIGGKKSVPWWTASEILIRPGHLFFFDLFNTLLDGLASLLNLELIVLHPCLLRKIREIQKGAIQQNLLVVEPIFISRKRLQPVRETTLAIVVSVPLHCRGIEIEKSWWQAD